jgi:hypothetical protein
MAEPTVTADRLARAAEAIASRRRLTQHSQLCPVWTRREHGAVIGDCDCWILAGARKDAQAALDAADGTDG